VKKWESRPIVKFTMNSNMFSGFIDRKSWKYKTSILPCFACAKQRQKIPAASNPLNVGIFFYAVGVEVVTLCHAAICSIKTSFFRSANDFRGGTELTPAAASPADTYRERATVAANETRYLTQRDQREKITSNGGPFSSVSFAKCRSARSIA